MPPPEGVRIQATDPALRNVVYVVPIMTRPLNPPHDCPSCLVAHPVKCVHLLLDDTGSTVVSAGVLALLQEAGIGPGTDLQQAGTLVNPPPLNMGMQHGQPAGHRGHGSNEGRGTWPEGAGPRPRGVGNAIGGTG